MEEMEMGFQPSEQRPAVRRQPRLERRDGDTGSSREWTGDKPLPLNIPEEERLGMRGDLEVP